MQRIHRLIIAASFALGLSADVMTAQDAPFSVIDASRRAALRDSLSRAQMQWISTPPMAYRVRIQFRCECARPLDDAP